MLAGVLFKQDEATGDVTPEFVNQFILTGLYLSTLSSPRLRVPILPSIATLVHPLYSIAYVTLRIFRTILLVILSFLPGSRQPIKKISVANTNIVFHDGRALATCESGPPMRVQLPGLETVGWFNGAWAENENAVAKQEGEKEAVEELKRLYGSTLGEESMGIIGWMREWSTAHPKIDPLTGEMLMFHSSFLPPYVQYSIIPQQPQTADLAPRLEKKLNAVVPGVKKAKMMHDFGVSLTHTVIMDLPLTLDPMNQLVGKPPVSYDSSQPSRFGVFSRRQPEQVRWFETDGACIFHTANTWDTVDAASGEVTGVEMLACRLTSATLVYASGNIAPPVERKLKAVEAKRKRMPFFSPYHDEEFEEGTVWERAAGLESPGDEKEALIRITDIHEETDEDAEEAAKQWDEEQCRLCYYSFSLSSPLGVNEITQQWALATIPFEFPSVRADREMQDARYVYGCSTSSTSFGSALGKATKIDVLVKVDVTTLIARGLANPPRSVSGSVDSRSMTEILDGSRAEKEDETIQAFKMPGGWFAQEPRFVPAASNESEDDGFLLFYAFDENQLDERGDLPSDQCEGRARSELWVVSAKDMETVVAKVRLPQRVPYGLHGGWFSGEQIAGQRGLEQVRTVDAVRDADEVKGVWGMVRRALETQLD
ncbi:hypothetical protein LTR56_026420 [Elasticomyces elasticus]|nr:hypothetical protein LTR56_026420 [Elasticomyces elasticus]KAK3620139.1 hypothetical protein LTR22_025711 [Elasticomyces elasticus]KAK4907666.1 hypothetical protein LTR49_023319 [Elasticomyces elasticus]KAK5747910.1 hypothetical protein LTS12_022056 [Elasticomyces elasticus]